MIQVPADFRTMTKTSEGFHVHHNDDSKTHCATLSQALGLAQAGEVITKVWWVVEFCDWTESYIGCRDSVSGEFKLTPAHLS